MSLLPRRHRAQHVREIAEHRNAMKTTLHRLVVTTPLFLLAVAHIGAQTLTTLHAFTGSADGSGPGSLLQGGDGTLYGTTTGGGTPGHGTVYKLTLAGVITTLYSLTGGSDGQQPLSLLQGRDGNFTVPPSAAVTWAAAPSTG